MTIVAIELLFSLVLCGVALRANACLRHVDRLPMQWSLTGKVTWYAPRQLALAFIPALAACFFVSLTLLSVNVRPRPGQEGMVLPTVIGICVMFLGIQLLHLWLAKQTLRRNGG